MKKWFILLVILFGLFLFNHPTLAQTIDITAYKSTEIPTIDGYDDDWNDTWSIIEMSGLSGQEIPYPNVFMQARHDGTTLYMIFKYQMYLSTHPADCWMEFWSNANGNGDVYYEAGDDNIILYGLNFSDDQHYFFGWVTDSSDDVLEFKCHFNGSFWIFEFSHLLRSGDLAGDDFQLSEGDSIEFILRRVEQPYGVSRNNASYSLTLTIERKNGTFQIPGFSISWLIVTLTILLSVFYTKRIKITYFNN